MASQSWHQLCTLRDDVRTAYCPTCQEFAAICPYALEHPGPAKE